MPFLDRLDISPASADMRRWRLNNEFKYKHIDPSYVAGEQIITIPEGFETDFASVPRAFWGLVSPFGKHGKPALLHDYLYHKNVLSRKAADRLFLMAMKEIGVNRIKRSLMHRAVRWFGLGAWNNHRKNDYKFKFGFSKKF